MDGLEKPEVRSLYQLSCDCGVHNRISRGTLGSERRESKGGSTECFCPQRVSTHGG